MGNYEALPTYVRKDPLTAGRYNQLRQNSHYLQQLFRSEHVESTGEHNAQEIARTLGTVAWNGAAYGTKKFNSDLVSLANPSVGKVVLTLSGGRYDADMAPLMLQNASERGDGTPCLSWASWDTDTQLTVYSSYWAGTLGSTTDAHWQDAGEDASFHLGLHGPRLDQPSIALMGGSIYSSNGLRAGSTGTNYNAYLQTAADLQARMNLAHTAGVHDTQTVSKLWAHVQWDGAAWTIVRQENSSTFDPGPLSYVNQLSTGIASLQFQRAFNTTDYQVFIDVDYGRVAAGSVDDYFIAVPPRDERTTRGFPIYFYKKSLSAGIEVYDRNSGVDFYLLVHDDHS